MLERAFGGTGLTVSEFGFGGIPIQRLTEAQALEVVRYAYDRGVTFYDTAAGYSTSEERIGKALEDVRGRCIIATKNGAADAAGCRAQIERSLERLRTDYIDVFQFHGVNSDHRYHEIMASRGAYEAAEKARAEGLVRRIGFSSHNGQTALEMVRSGLFETIQFPFNLIATGPADHLFPEAAARGMAIIVMKPFGGGAIESVEAAFSWLRQHPAYIPIPGIDTVAHLDEILDVYSGPNVVSAEMPARWEEIRNFLGVYFCRRCGYCGPCPHGVSVMGLMTLDTLMKRFPEDRLLSEEWIVQGAASLDNCVDCGQCEAGCPYNLSIRVKMRENRDAYYRWRGERE